MLRKISLIFITILTFISSLFALDYYYEDVYDAYWIQISHKGWHQVAFEFEDLENYASTIWTWEDDNWKVWVNPDSKYDPLRDYVNSLGIGKEYNDKDIIIGWVYVPEDPRYPVRLRTSDPNLNDFSFTGWKMTTAPIVGLDYFNTTYDVVSIWSWDENHWLVYSPVPEIQEVLDKYGVERLTKIYGSQGFWIYRDPSIYCTFKTLDSSQMSFKQFINELAKSNPALYLYDNASFSNLKKFMCEHIQEFRGLSRDEFVNKIYDMFKFLNDEHLTIDGKRLVTDSWDYYRSLTTFDASIVNEYLESDLSSDYVSLSYIKDSNILYVRVSSFNFSEYINSQIYQKYIQVRDYLGQVDAIIFDFRGNQGGYIYSAFDSLTDDQILLGAASTTIFMSFSDAPYMTSICFSSNKFNIYKEKVDGINVSNIIFLVDYKTASTAEIVPVILRTYGPDKTVIIGTDTSWRNFDLDHYVPVSDTIISDSCFSSSRVQEGSYTVNLVNGAIFNSFSGYTKFIKDNKTYTVLWNGVIPDIKLDYDEIKEHMDQGKDVFIEKALEYLQGRGVSLGESNDILDVDLTLSNIDKYTKTPPVVPVFDNITEYFSE